MTKATLKPAPRATPPAPTIQAVGAELERLLIAMIAEHRDMSALADAHRLAIASADRPAIDRCVQLQQLAASRLGELTGKRMTIVRSAVAALRTSAVRFSGEPTASIIAAACADPQRTRLLALADEARKVAEHCSQQQRTLKLAAETLLAHMQGLMAQVSRALSHAGTYARPTAPGYAPQVVSTLDMTS
jgi:hypothetical protein